MKPPAVAASSVSYRYIFKFRSSLYKLWNVVEINVIIRAMGTSALKTIAVAMALGGCTVESRAASSASIGATATPERIVKL